MTESIAFMGTEWNADREGAVKFPELLFSQPSPGLRHSNLTMKKLFRLANLVVVALSETPLHRLFSHQVMVLRFNGRRSGRAFTIPVSFMTISQSDSEQVLCMTDSANIWWKNLLDPQVMAITLRGQRYAVSATVVTDDHQAIERALASFCRRSRVSALFSGVSMSGGEPNSADLTVAAKRHVLIELTQQK